MNTSEPYIPLWAYLDIEHTERILSLRDTLYEPLSTTEYTLEDNPHITLHRGFQIPASQTENFFDILSTSPLEGRTVTITGVKLWPDVTNPHVVMLDIDADLEPTVSELKNAIPVNGGREFHDPVPKHITLFRAGVQTNPDWNGLSEEDNEKLFALQNSLDFPWETTITDVILDKYNRPSPSNTSFSQR